MLEGDVLSSILRGLLASHIAIPIPLLRFGDAWWNPWKKGDSTCKTDEGGYPKGESTGR